ncbi:MAG: ABC transporter ATP-binding protein [Planctomycetota bacterium]
MTTQQLALPEGVALAVRGAAKKFCKHLRRSMAYGIFDLGRNLVGIRPDTARLRKEEFWALQDIGFELRRGEALGLIGPNGSGKTTLLRMIAGILPPDRGEILVGGRVGALIALGAGFHPHMTGRENVYLNGTILGMTRRELDEKFDDIVEFAEIGDFLDAPVNSYSSGMRVRLGFAIASRCDPDVLLVDEVLAVGDSEFRLKCHNWITEFMMRGKAVVFVSHNEAMIAKHCDRALLLWQGRGRFLGPTEEALDHYHEALAERDAAKSRAFTITDGTTCVEDVTVRDESGQPCEEFATGQSCLVDVRYRSRADLAGGFVAIRFEALGGVTVFGTTTAHQGLDLPAEPGDRLVRLQISALPLVHGTYWVTAAVNDAAQLNVAYANRAARFRVRGPRSDHRQVAGPVYMEHRWGFVP